ARVQLLQHLGRGFARALALWVLLAAQEWAASAGPDHHRASAFGARLADLDCRQRLLWGGRHHRLGFFLEVFRYWFAAAAFREGAATQERTPPTFANHHRRTAFFTGDAGVDGLDRIALGVHVFGVLALGIAGASQEWTAFAFANDHLPTAFLAL